MPAPGKLWRHVIINTKSSWHHGDPRGFRSKSHRVHSSGDYRYPPPPGEHQGLYRYRLSKSRPTVKLEKSVRATVGKELRDRLQAAGHAVIAVAVTNVHAHLLVELPDNILRVRAIVGVAKAYASKAVKQNLPGAVWSRGGTYKPVHSRAHQIRAYAYILFDQGSDAWTWSFQDGDIKGMFGRHRLL